MKPLPKRRASSAPAVLRVSVRGQTRYADWVPPSLDGQGVGGWGLMPEDATAAEAIERARFFAEAATRGDIVAVVLVDGDR